MFGDGTNYHYLHTMTLFMYLDYLTTRQWRIFYFSFGPFLFCYYDFWPTQSLLETIVFVCFFLQSINHSGSFIPIVYYFVRS